MKFKWTASSNIIAPIGLALIGAGVSVIGEAIILKMSTEGFWNWFIYGTLGLVIFNAGISVFGEAVVKRTKEDLAKENEASLLNNR